MEKFEIGPPTNLFFPSDSKKVKLNKKGWKEKKESKKGKIKVESEEKG